MLKRPIKYALGSAAVLTAAAMLTFATRNDFGMARNMELLVNMMRELTLNYVDSLDTDRLMSDAAAGMVQRLDPYTEFLPEEEMSDFEFLTTGKYGGVGALIRQKGDRIVIAEPYRGFPADRAGLRIGDQFLEIAGQSAEGMTTQQVSTLLKGDPNTTVKVKVERLIDGEPFETTLRRERIVISGIGYAGMLTDSIGYIQHRDFTEGCYEDMRAAVERLQAEGARALVLDYRNNGGGIMQEAVKIVSMFVPKGTEVVETRGRNDHNVYRTQQDPIAADLPLAVLVNGNTASAAEIVSGSLQDLDRAVLIGQRTFGKGLVQSPRPLGYNAYLKMTTAKYHIPSGRCIQAIDYSARSGNGSVRAIPDSLIGTFRTRNGRKVYDGGGIMPDLKTEPDYISRFDLTLYAMGYIHDFADDYVRRHGIRTIDNRTFSITEADYDDFVAFMADKEVPYESDTRRALNQIKEAVKADHYESALGERIRAIESELKDDKATNLETYRNEIIRTLNDAIILRYGYSDGVTEHSLVTDADAAAAVELLRDPERYRRIVTEQDTARK